MDIADIKVRMEAEIKLEACLYNKYGIIKGIVKYISFNSFNCEQLGAFILLKWMLMLLMITLTLYLVFFEKIWRKIKGEIIFRNLLIPLDKIFDINIIYTININKQICY